MKTNSSFVRPTQRVLTSVISYIIALHGFLIIVTPFVFISLARHSLHIYPGRFVFDIQLLLALTLIYLSVLLRRRKRKAWLVAIVVYVGFMAVSLGHVMNAHLQSTALWVSIARDIVMPLLIIGSLIASRSYFKVRSDVRAFAVAVQISLLVLLAALLYGVAGFIALNRHDFHKEISISEAVHRTLDQFDLTTDNELLPHTRRAQTFIHSLSFISVASMGYVFISLFQPIRARVIDQTTSRRLADTLLKAFPSNSEDFFKLWPHDKFYFFTDNRQSGLAYGVRSGVALVVGDPIGNAQEFPKLLRQFTAFCEVNDWQVACVHTSPEHTQLYKSQNFMLQKIGEEAVLYIPKFIETTSRSKYFRQINNRFTKQDYTVELSQPPHNAQLLKQLRNISNQWLEAPGRKERRFMMGNFNAEYLQQCPLVLLRDKEGVVQGFLNQLPDYVPKEANFDMLRHSRQAPGNSNDFILLSWIRLLHEQGYTKLNLGLCPLAGLDASDEAASVINSSLSFLYANGDRFYSFSGLQRFKAKYNPEWHSRYIAYRGGVRGFTKALAALNRAMKA